MMRSCGTPWSIRTSTALMAEPPVAEKRVCKRVISSRRRSEPKGPTAPDDGFSLRSETVDRTKLTKHGVKEQAVPALDVVRELGVKELGLGRLLVPLDQDLSYPDRTAGDYVSADLVLAAESRRRRQRGRRACRVCGMEGQTDRQHSRRPASMASPARMIETPQIRPSKLTPL